MKTSRRMEDNMVKLMKFREAVGSAKRRRKKKEREKDLYSGFLAIIGIAAAVRQQLPMHVRRYPTPDYLQILTTTLTMILRTRIWTCEDNLERSFRRERVGLRIAETCHQEQTDLVGFGAFEYLGFGTARNARLGSVQIKLYRLRNAGDDGMFLRERKNQKFRFRGDILFCNKICFCMAVCLWNGVRDEKGQIMIHGVVRNEILELRNGGKWS
ncbi:MAG: hypothetical protein ACLU3U_04760 [Gallintestinimicrobium sp.]